jgi:aerobic carbon-monoxide dehydrogenase large subunit
MSNYKGRKEDPRLLTGKGTYTSDCNLPGQLHGVFLRSDRAHAKILKVDVAAAGKAPGVRAVLTGESIAPANLKRLQPLVAYPGKGGMKIIVPDRPALARGRVRYVGEAVALVIADTAMNALSATELINVDYDDLPAVIGVEAALAAGATLVHDEIPGNVCFDFDYGDEQKTADLIAKADHVVRLTMESPRVAPTPMEPRAVLAAYDAGTGTYAIRCEHQGANAMRESLAAQLGVEQSKVRVEFTDIGGAFGARTAPYPEYAVLLHAAKVVGAPVKWVSTRSEDFLNDGHGRAMRLAGELALDKAGNFIAIRTDWLSESGAYLTQAGALTNTGNGKTIGPGPYRVQAMYGRQRQIMTNTAPTEAFRGAGRPEAVYVVERLIDEAAALLKRDPLELRGQNVIPREAYPYTTVTGTVFDSADYPGMIATAILKSEWKSFEERRAASARSGKLRGIGAASFVEPAGGGGLPKDQVAVLFAKDGKNSGDGAPGDIQLYMAAGASGQSHETIFPEMVGEWLGIDPARIALRAGDPDGPALMGGAAIGSRTALAQGSAFRHAATEIIKKGLDLASKDLEAPASDIEFRDGRYVVKGTDRAIAMAEIIVKHRPASGPHPLDTIAENPALRTFPTGVHVCEVEIDRDTGEAEILTYTAVDDVGRVINHVMAEGQIHGGVMQSAGHVFGEQVVYDPASGQMLTGSFMDYTMPRADLVREFRVHDHSVPTPNNVLGAKGAGEAGTTGGLPACFSAVMDALRSAGVKHFDLPATPARVWAALRDAKAA